MPYPINAVKTRVIQTEHGYVAQLTNDGMMWFDLPDPLFFGGKDKEDLMDMKYLATRVALAASQLPSSGTVVWTSDAK